MTTRRPSLPIAFVASLAACTSAPDLMPDWHWRTEFTAAELDALPAAPALLTGYDEARAASPLMVGDSAVFGLHLLHGSERRSWFVRLTAMEPESAIADGLSLQVEVFDEASCAIAAERVTVTRYFVGGALRACQHPLDAAPGAAPLPPGSSLSLAPRSNQSQAAVAMCDVLRLVAETDALADILWQAIRKPSLFRVMFGLRISAGMSFTDARPGHDHPTAATAFEFPMRLVVNDTPALLCTVTAVESVRPVRVCGGIVQLVGHDPLDATRRVVLRLLAARCAR